MRVAHVMAGAVQGGAEGFFERLVLAQHRAGLDVLAVIRREPGRAARLEAGGVAPLQLGFGGPLDWLTAGRLRRALLGFRPQVVVAWMNRAAGFARAATRPGDGWAMAGRLGGAYALRHYGACDLLAANTQGLCDWIASQGWPADRVRLMPNFAADLAGAPPATLPFPPGAVPLLAMGRLHPNKDFATLLRAVARLPAEVHLALAGEGPERGALEALAGELGLGGRVAFLGWRQDVGALLAASRMLVVPSRIEPLGNVVLEGFSANRPVVATAADGPREVMRDGETGRLVPIGDHAALAEAIGQLLADPAMADRLAAAGRAGFIARHAEAPALAAWAAFLDEAAARREAA
ncbi:glycosyltransferase [Falsiroseomonas tokyonensis]|uniref:Glycosyltransferase n=1 Tax=Falsiroseomonas tokyonensis TaxID=430521 RepID=A0ABV7BNR0_9PROT|nr:glycosyltransferase [Falsiroseomonas tokyonensis]MBU8536238.1 glycosyltransferase [Falsiroseomonas tokyonensis]